MKIVLLCGLLLGILFVFAEDDALYPEGAPQNFKVLNPKTVSILTPPIIGVFPAPDGAMRGLGYDGTHLWAANSGDGNSQYGRMIYKLDPTTGAVINSYANFGGYPYGLAFDGVDLWYSEFSPNTIYKLDTASFTIIKSFTAPTSDYSLDLGWDGTYLYCSEGNVDNIVVIDTGSGQSVGSIPATYSSGNVAPYGLTIIPRLNQMWVCDGNYGSNMVNVWDFNTTVWIDQWPGSNATYPAGLAYDPVGERVWVSCWQKDSIWIYDISGMGSEEYGNDTPEKRISAYPNPFKNYLRIEYLNDNVVFGGLDIYDVNGRLLIGIDNKDFMWNGMDKRGNTLGAGVYFIKDRTSRQSVKIIKTE